MEKPLISFVIAMSKQTRAMGKNNDLLWKIPADMKHFREITTGHPMLMGRKTFDSIGHPLPNRTNIVITRDTDWTHEGVTVYHSLEEALELAQKIDQKEICIIGGAQIFTLALPVVDRIHLTLVDDPVDGDVYFPEFDTDVFTEISRTEHEHDGLHFSFVTLDRKTKEGYNA